jgi:2-polyprenyl-3-methyl-5-hydroxy-6-metoxy-1,4-benzoquinol methylase
MTNFRYYKQKKERKWNLPKMKFDLIIHHDTLEHVKKPYLYLKQSLLFLKPRGLLFFSTPNLLRYTNLMKLFLNKLDFPLLLDGVGSLESGQSYHEQEFTKFQLKTLLEECNFKNIKIEHKFLNVPFFNISFNLKNYYLSHILFAKAQR